jgi:hypothetical protein
MSEVKSSAEQLSDLARTLDKGKLLDIEDEFTYPNRKNMRRLIYRTRIITVGFWCCKRQIEVEDFDHCPSYKENKNGYLY